MHCACLPTARSPVIPAGHSHFPHPLLSLVRESIPLGCHHLQEASLIRPTDLNPPLSGLFLDLWTSFPRPFPTVL